MNPREQFLVERLVERLATQPPQPVDADAQREIELLMRRRPDAPYLLLQRALQLEEALKLAYEEIEQMRQQRGRQTAPDANAFGRSGAGAAGGAAPGAGRAGAAPGLTGGGMAGGADHGGPGGPGAGAGRGGLFGGAPGALAGGMAQPAPMQSAGGGFLRSAGAVAAGVVGGSLLFHGIENLLHPGGSGLLGGGQAPANATETTNNFFEAPRDDATAGAGFDSLPDSSQADDQFAATDDSTSGDYAADDGQLASDDSGQWDDSGGSDGDWA